MRDVLWGWLVCPSDPFSPCFCTFVCCHWLFECHILGHNLCYSAIHIIANFPFFMNFINFVYLFFTFFA